MKYIVNIPRPKFDDTETMTALIEAVKYYEPVGINNFFFQMRDNFREHGYGIASQSGPGVSYKNEFAFDNIKDADEFADKFGATERRTK